MYKSGTLIIYGRTGVCCVEGITEKIQRGETKPTPYYSLRPLYQSCTITVPVGKVDDGTVFSRPIMSKAQAQEFIKSLPSLTSEPYHNHNLNQLRDHYCQQLQSLNSCELAQMLRSIYAKKQEAMEHNRKLSVVDQHFMEEAEALLYGELATALEISKDEVRSYFLSTLK